MEKNKSKILIQHDGNAVQMARQTEEQDQGGATGLKGFKKVRLEKKAKQMNSDDEDYGHGIHIDYSANQFTSNKFQKEYHAAKKSSEQKKSSFRQSLLKKRQKISLADGGLPEEQDQQSTEFMSLINTEVDNSDPSKADATAAAEGDQPRHRDLLDAERSKEQQLASEKAKKYQKAVFKRKQKQAQVRALFDRTEDDEAIGDVLDQIDFARRDDEEGSEQRLFFDAQYLDEVERAKAYKAKMGAKRQKLDADKDGDFLAKYDEVRQLKPANEGEYSYIDCQIEAKLSLFK